MIEEFIMPVRAECDGEVRVEYDVDGNGTAVIECTHNGVVQVIRCSKFNAIRLMAIIAFGYGVRFRKDLERRIKL